MGSEERLQAVGKVHKGSEKTGKTSEEEVKDHLPRELVFHSCLLPRLSAILCGDMSVPAVGWCWFPFFSSETNTRTYL